MENLKNVGRYSVMHAMNLEEQGVFLEVLDTVLGAQVWVPKFGTIMIYEQQRGSNARCAFHFHFNEGEKWWGDDQRGSDELAEEAIDMLLLWPDDSCEMAYKYYAKATEFGQLETKLYHDEHYCAMVLNTALGRFIISSYADFGRETFEKAKTQNMALMIVMANILAQVKPEDRTLYYGVMNQLSYNVGREVMDIVEVFKPIIDQMLSDDSFQRVREWHAWRARMQAKNQVKMYFE